jgi:undecaprenyl-diphosphatase
MRTRARFRIRPSSPDFPARASPAEDERPIEPGQKSAPDGNREGVVARENEGMPLRVAPTAELEEPAPPPAASDCCLHHHPPATPAAFYRERRGLLVGLAVVFVGLAMAGAIASGRLLLTWDEPIQRFVEEHRNGLFDVYFRTASRFGSTLSVLALGGFLAALTWRRCRAVAYAVLFATLARPVLEFTLKSVVDRDRPNFERLVDGTGPSFPSGHVMAAVALWGLLPLVVGLYTRSRAIWWASVIVAGVMIVSIAASRVYLGVHWFSDVTAGLVLGSFFLLAVEQVLVAAHRRRGCGRDGSALRSGRAPG